MLHLKPVEGKSIPWPERSTPGKTMYLPAEGAEVENSIYWQRRLSDLDVETFEPKPAGKAKE